MKLKKLYLGGDIMSKGSNLARQQEYEQVMNLGLNMDIYSPVKNKSINDKASVTEEENNHLAEKITKADLDRMWEADVVVMSPEQNAIGSLCETGALFGWKWMAEHLLALPKDQWEDEINRILNKDIYVHYFDIRTNHLNEKDWRRSFSINQLLYGMILDIEKNGDIEDFEDILQDLKKNYK